MLEIIVVILLCGRMGKLMRAKGRKPLLFQIMLVAFWLGGEIGASIIYAIAQVVITGGEPEIGFVAFIVAIGGGVVGAGIAFLIASLVPPSESVTRTSSQQYPGSPNFDNIEIQPPPDPNNPYQPPST